jgi:hypothetical protein
MTRTEDDVRMACVALEADAPSVDDVLAAMIGPSRHRPRRRRELRGYLAVAATVIAVAANAIVALAWPTHHRAAPPPATRQPADPALSRVDFTVVPPRGYETVEYSSGALFQRASLIQVVPKYDNGWATITLYRPGGYHGTTTGKAVRVNGQRGFVVADAHPTSVAYRDTDPTVHERAVVWQYAPGAWAMATGARGLTPAAVDQANVSLAAAVRPGTAPVRVPMKLGYLPDALTLESASTVPRNMPEVHGQYGALSLKDQTPAGSPLDTAPWGSAMDIVAWVEHTPFAGPPFGCAANARTFAVGGNKGCYLSDHAVTSGLIVDVAGHTVRIRVDAAHYGKYSDAELVRIVAGLRFAPNVTDPATWFPAASALPKE